MYTRIIKEEKTTPVTNFIEKTSSIRKIEEPSLSKLMRNTEYKKKDNEKIESQTVYYNIRQKQFENRYRKKNYFKDDQTSFLKTDEIQQKIYQYENVDSILRLYNGHKFTFSTKNLVTTMHRLARYLPVEKRKHKKHPRHIKRAFPFKTSEKRIQSLFFTIEQNLEMFSLSEKVIILWSIAKMNFFDTDLYNKTLEDILKNLESLTLDQCCLIAWCISKSRSRSPKLFGMISLEIEKKINSPGFLETFKQDNDESLLVENNIEKTESDDEVDDLLDIKIEKVDQNKTLLIRKDKNTAQSLSILFWSFAKKDVQDATLFAKLIGLFFQHITEYNLHSIALNMYALAKTNSKLQHNDIDSLELRLLEIELEKEKSLTIKTIIVLLEQIGITNNRGVYNKYLDAFFKKNSQNISPRFTSEILRVIASKQLFQENYSSKILKSIQKNIKDFNLDDCLSCFESICKNLNKLKDEETNKTLEIIIIKLDMFQNDIGIKQTKIIEKICNESKFSHKIINKLLQLKLGNK